MLEVGPTYIDTSA